MEVVVTVVVVTVGMFWWGWKNKEAALHWSTCLNKPKLGVVIMFMSRQVSISFDWTYLPA